MACREALNNVIKHADASEVEIRLSVQKDRLLVSITDNGCGFDPTAGSTRNGLRNMKQRLESIGGAFDCESAPGRGTRIHLAMRLD